MLYLKPEIMKKLLVVAIVALNYSCSQDGSMDAKMFEIAERQITFNQIKVDLLEDKIKHVGHYATNKVILQNIEEFHNKLTGLHDQIKDMSQDQEQLRKEINTYLNDFLQVINPELNHESFLDGAVSRGLLAIELANIEKSFLFDQEFHINENIIDFRNLQAYIIPEKAVVKDGETFKANLILTATSDDWGENVKMEINGQEIAIENGRGVVELVSRANRSGLSSKTIVGSVILPDTTYRVELKYWVTR